MGRRRGKGGRLRAGAGRGGCGWKVRGRGGGSNMARRRGEA